MIYYALMQDGSQINLTEDDFSSLKRMIGRNIERGAILTNGDVLKTSAVYYLGSKEEEAPEIIFKTENPELTKAVIEAAKEAIMDEAVAKSMEEAEPAVLAKKVKEAELAAEAELVAKAAPKATPRTATKK